MALTDLKDKWDGLKNRYGDSRANSVAVILLIGAASIGVRLLIHYRFDSTALLYVGIPFLISLAITLYRPVTTDRKWWHQYRDHSLTAMTVFMTSSVVLFEGFVCVLLFLPIYFFVVSITFLIHWGIVSRAKRRGKTFVSVLPLLIIVSSLEGTSETLSVSRDSHVVVAKVANLTAEQVMANIALPFDLRKKREWLISIFPMPYKIEAGSLSSGDVHYVRTRYHRWFFTNTHEGEMHLQIVDVQPNRVRTRIIHDSTYFSSYLRPIGTEITLTELAPNRTQISLRIDYQRKLDPAWYFHPLQQYAVGQMAEFLIDEVMIRE